MPVMYVTPDLSYEREGAGEVGRRYVTDHNPNRTHRVVGGSFKFVQCASLLPPATLAHKEE